MFDDMCTRQGIQFYFRENPRPHNALMMFYLLNFTLIYQSVKQKSFWEYTMGLSFLILAY